MWETGGVFLTLKSRFVDPSTECKLDGYGEGIKKHSRKQGSSESRGQKRERERGGYAVGVRGIKSNWPTGTGVVYPISNRKSQGEREHGRSNVYKNPNLTTSSFTPVEETQSMNDAVKHRSLLCLKIKHRYMTCICRYAWNNVRIEKGVRGWKVNWCNQYHKVHCGWVSAARVITKSALMWGAWI